jgi:hypothetical protein
MHNIFHEYHIRLFARLMVKNALAASTLTLQERQELWEPE